MSRSKLEEDITDSRIDLITRHPFLGSVVMRLKFVRKDEIRTAATDGDHIYYNEEFLQSLNRDELTTLIAHELLHCILQHHERAARKIRPLWNVACDYAINPMLFDDFNFTRLDNCCYDQKYKNLSAEAIYNRLAKSAKIMKAAIAAQDAGESMPKGMGNGKIQGDVLPKNRVNNDGQTANEWRGITANAVKEAKRQGDHIPDSIDFATKFGTNIDKRWMEALWRYFTPSKHDMSWARPNRRFIGQNIYLPSVHGEKIEHAVVVIDTSGSVSAAERAIFLGAARETVNATSPGIFSLIAADTKPRVAARWTQSELPIVEWPTIAGGGGTDFAPAIEMASNFETPPTVLIYLTDLYGPCGLPPVFPVLWVCNTDHEDAPFGETVRIAINE